MTNHHTPRDTKDRRPRAEDWDALEFIDASRLARTGQVQRRMGWTQDHTQERLRVYFDKPLQWVTKFPERTGNKGGSKEDIYGLTSKGVRALKKTKRFRLGPKNLDKCNEALLDTFGYITGNYEHTLGVTEVAARFHAGARATEGRVRFIDQPELFTQLPEVTKRRPKLFSWQVTTPCLFPEPNEDEEYYDDEWRQGVLPDRVMGRILMATGKKSFLFFEYYKDMPLFRRNLVNQRSVMLKLLSLVRTRERQQLEGFVTERFGFNNFRGLIILDPSTENERISMSRNFYSI